MKRFLALGLLATTLVGAATIVTTRSSAKVYPNSIRRVYEQPLYVLDKGEVVEVLKWSSPLTKVRNRRGRVGWAETALLDSLKRPPILNLMIDSTPEPPKPGKAHLPKVVAKDTAVVVKKWNAPVDTGIKPVEKPVDFRKDTSHISAPTKADSAK